MLKSSAPASDPGFGFSSTSQPDPWTLFACPVTQVMKLSEITEAVALSDWARSGSLAEASSHTTSRFEQHDGVRVTVYNPMKGRRVSLALQFSKNGVPSFECSEPSGLGKLPSPWRDVQKAMARFGCVVEVKAKPETPWTKVGPSVRISEPSKSAVPTQPIRGTNARAALLNKSVNRAPLTVSLRESRRTREEKYWPT